MINFLGPLQSSSDGSGQNTIIDLVVTALYEFVSSLIEPLSEPISDFGEQLIQTIIGTPYPDRIFTAPTNFAWKSLYDFYWQAMIPVAFAIFGISIMLVIFLESTSHLFSSYHRANLKRRAFSGLLGVLSWWWIAAISLQFTNELAVFLTPSLAGLTLFETVSLTGAGLIITVFALFTEFVIFIMIGLIYLSRQIVLFLLVLLMPILIALWIPGVGPFEPMSRFMEKLAGFYVPFLFMTIPVALLLRLGDLLGNSFGLSFGGIGAWITALVIPVLAVFAPLVMFWQAGGIFRVAGQVARHTSFERSRGRIHTDQKAGSTENNVRDNFLRGERGRSSATRNGQMIRYSSTSGSHTAGGHSQDPGSRWKRSFYSKNQGSSNRPSKGNSLNSNGKGSRESDFDLLRENSSHTTGSRSKERDSNSNTEESIPPYIQ